MCSLIHTLKKFSLWLAYTESCFPVQHSIMWTISGWEATCWTLPQHVIACHYNDFWRRQWQPTPVLLPGKSHGPKSMVGCSPWGLEESDMTERLHFHFSLSWTGEGNGNLLQCSCLKNPKDGGAWWAAVYGVAQSWTQLKWRSSSSSSIMIFMLQHFIVFHETCLTPSKTEFLESHLQIESYEVKRGSGRRNCTYHPTDNLFSLY